MEVVVHLFIFYFFAVPRVAFIVDDFLLPIVILYIDQFSGTWYAAVRGSKFAGSLHGGL